MDEQNLHLPLMIIRLFQSVAITDNVAVNNPVNISFLKSASIPEGWSHEEEYWWEWPKCTPEHSRQSFRSPAMCEQACFPTHTRSVSYLVFFSLAILMANALICISLVMSIIEHLKNTLKNLFCKLLVLSFARFSIGLLVNGILKVRVNWIVGRKSSFFFFKIFFDVDHFRSIYCICYNKYHILVSVFLATRHMVSELPDQGSNWQLLHWKLSTQPLAHQGSPMKYILTLMDYI